MAEEGQTIENPMTGERIVFGETGRTTGGRLLRFELFLAPGGRVGGGPHKHPYEERFRIRRGALGCRVGVRRWRLEAGASIRIPPSRTHYLWNATLEEAHATVELRPGDQLERFFTSLFAIASTRPESFRGLPGPLQGALLASEFDMFGPLVPVALQRPVTAALAFLARRRGHALPA
ncbi:MAG: cupin domain-containing protein [Actinomycetota bacterium]|nr:cupin domain-containing protein [Actinomycetota bacterium]